MTEDLSAHKLLLFTIEKLLRNIGGSFLLIQVTSFNIKMAIHIYNMAVHICNIQRAELVIATYLIIKSVYPQNKFMCIQSALHFHGFHIHRFNKNQIKNISFFKCGFYSFFFFSVSSKKAKLEFVMCWPTISVASHCIRYCK